MLFLLFLLLLPLLLVCLAEGVAGVLDASANVGAALFGISAAIAPAAMPTDNKAVAINLVMGSPSVVLRASGRIRRIDGFRAR